MYIKINKWLSTKDILKRFGLAVSQRFSFLDDLISFKYESKYFSNYYASANLLDINNFGLLI